MVDPAEYVDQEELDEKDDVAIINPDQLDGESPDKPRADNCTFSPLLFTLGHGADIYCSCSYERNHIPTNPRTTSDPCGS